MMRISGRLNEVQLLRELQLLIAGVTYSMTLMPQ